MRRDFRSLADGPFDVLVVGGGVTGAWTALDAAQRGLRVALVERADWAAGTSSASSKLIHGGLRYLENLELGLVRRALHERAALLRIAPHRVRELRFVIPSYVGDRVPPWKMRAGLLLYDLLAGAQAVGRRGWLDRERALTRAPFLRPEGLRGAFTYGDAGTDDARLVLELVDGALRLGARAVNYAAVTDWIRRDGETVGAVVEDGVGGERIEVRARVSVLAAGVWSGLAAKGAERDVAASFCMTKGVHLVLPALPTRDAMLLTARSDGRVFFAIPWYGRTMVGTTDTPWDGDPDDACVEEEDVRYLLEEASQALDAGWTRHDVVGAFAGLRMLRRSAAKTPGKMSRDWTLEVVDPGLLVPVGGKLTTARHDASRIVDRALGLLRHAMIPCRTDEVPSPWALGVGEAERLLARAAARGLDDECALTALGRHGRRLSRLLERLETRPEEARRIVPELPFCAAEIGFCRESEMVVRDEDLFRRRVPLAILAPESVPGGTDGSL